MLSRCYQVFNEGTVESAGISVDDYRSAVCAQLKSGADDANVQLKGRSRKLTSRGSVVPFSVDDDESLIRHVIRGKAPKSQKNVGLPSTSRGGKGKKTTVRAKSSSTKASKKVVKRNLSRVLMSQSSEEY